jgi:hypothetical protein
MKVKEAEQSGIIKWNNRDMIWIDTFLAVLQHCEKAVEVHFVTGDHVTILDNKDTANIINREVTNIDAVNSRHNHTEECLL